MLSYNYLFKTIIVGDSGVGKSCLLLQFTNRMFEKNHDATIGVGFGAKMIPIGNKLIKLYLWDTAGQEKFRCVTRPYYRDAVAALLVYDVTRRETFNHLGSWLKDIRELADPNVAIVLVGNKRDDLMRRQVSSEDGEQFAKENGLFFYESSAKMSENVDEAFGEAAKSVCKKIEDGVFDLSYERSGIRNGDYENVNGGKSNGLVSYKAKCCST